MSRFLKARCLLPENGFDVGFEIKKVDCTSGLSPLLVDARATGKHCNAQRLRKSGDRGRLSGAQKTATDFKHADTFNLPFAIIRQCADQTTNQGRAHVAHLRGDRIGKCYGCTTRSIVGKIHFPFAIDEAISNYLVVVALGNYAAQLHGGAATLVARHHGGTCDGWCGWDVFVTVNAGEFLD